MNMNLDEHDAKEAKNVISSCSGVGIGNLDALAMGEGQYF